MAEAPQSPLAMLVLVTPYTVLYIVNQLFLQGILDKIHYLFFELIFVLAFRKVFGLPDLTERFFPSQQRGIQSAEGKKPLKTNLANYPTLNSSNLAVKATTIASTTACGTLAGTPLGTTTAAANMTRTRTTTVKTTSFQDGFKTPYEADISQSPVSPRPSTLIKPLIKAMPYAQELGAMEKQLLDYINNTEIWDKVYTDPASSEMAIEVFQYKARPMCYKIIAQMCNTPAVTFDTLCDLENRLAWDPMCVEAKVLKEVTPGTTVQYIRTKAVWPTASRDTVVLGTVKDLGEQGLFMVNASIEFEAMPERVQEKIVRMQTAVAGHVITPLDGNRSRLTQIVDADMKGWIPDKVIQMVSTKAVPDGLRAVNKLLPKIDPYQDSKVLVKAAKAQQEIDATLIAPRPNSNNSGESMLKGHQNDLDEDPAEKAVEDLSTLESKDKDVDVSDDDGETNDMKGRSATHELRRQRSEGDISLSTLAERLRAVEAKIGIDRRSVRSRRQQQQDSASKESKDNDVRKGSGTSNAGAGALEKIKSGSTFRVFWEGIKENLGFGAKGKGSKIMVAVLVVAILGSSLAKFKRR
ncbi:START domain-containing protein 10 [Linnemannia schmuckeri]|uniref:START domain-containing protein 10 n=1 Tax=Linnemannia schmuckeri TaxID=64567 RepID=A0A9P5RVI0_9FUNG|nr:START domain-containing protein 10 [Linnemannia schmuckeri]